MVHVEKIIVKGKAYFKLVQNIRKGREVVHISKYLGNKFPTKEQLLELEKEFLQELHRREITKEDKALQKIKSAIINKLKREGITKAGIFGSYARGEQTPQSDVDILIEYRRNSRKSLLDMVRLERELSEKLGRKVDLVTYGSISPYLKERILNEEVKIL